MTCRAQRRKKSAQKTTTASTPRIATRRAICASMKSPRRIGVASESSWQLRLKGIALPREAEDELRAYSEELAARPQIVAVNKVELPGTTEQRAAVERFCVARGLPFHAISAVTGEGLPALVHEIGRRLASEPWVPAGR